MNRHDKTRSDVTDETEPQPVPSLAGLRFNLSYKEQVTLADGRTVSLRLLRPTDKQKLLQGLERMSPESRYMRFMGVRSYLNQAALRYLCEVDGYNHFAMGAVVENPDGSEEGVAVARFVRLESETSVAEPAIAVIDDYQGQGLGRALLNRLGSAARERDIERFRCDFLSSNRKIRHLLTDYGQNPTIRKKSDVVTMEFELPDPAANTLPGRR